MAVYNITSPDGKTQLVECRTSKAAIAHVATKGYKAETLKMGDIVKRVRSGEQIESIEEEKSAPKEPTSAPIIEHIEAAEAAEAEKDVPREEPQQEPSRGFAGRFQKKSA